MGFKQELKTSFFSGILVCSSTGPSGDNCVQNNLGLDIELCNVSTCSKCLQVSTNTGFELISHMLSFKPVIVLVSDLLRR